MSGADWTKGVGFVAAAMGTVATAKASDLAAGGLPMRTALVAVVVAGAVALAAYLSTAA